MTDYLTSFTLVATSTGISIDLTDDVVNNSIVVNYGIRGNGPRDRIASTGSMSFTLKNPSKKYSPDTAGAVAGWKRGLKVTLTMVYNGVTHVKFVGRIDKISITAGTEGARITNVTALDWLDFAAKYPLTGLSVSYNQTADQVITSLLAGMPIAPAATAYDTGTAVFPATFDTATNPSVAYSELAKIALSEMGYIYLRHSGADGEKLVFENMYHRNGLRDATLHPYPYNMLLETGSRLLLETGDMVLLEDVTDASFHGSNSMTDMGMTYGDNLINKVTMRAYPKVVDTSLKVLYSLSSPMMVGSNQTTTFKAGYTDPTGAGRKCAADPATMTAPAATTDYTMNSKEDGTGTNLTANLTVTAVYAVDGVTYTLKNTSTSAGYVRLLQARGYGIYSYNPIEATAESSVSYLEYGYQTETIDQTYQRDLAYGQIAAQQILDANKQPHSTLNTVTFCANRDMDHMLAFLYLDIGDMLQITETQTGINGLFYIQGVQYSLAPGGMIMFTFLVKAALTLTLGLSAVGVEFAAASTDMIGYGYLPQLINKTQRSVTAWVKTHSDVAIGIIAGAYAANGGWFMYVTNGSLAFYQEAPTTAGAWGASGAGGVLTTNTWYHVAITRDCTNHDTLPKMYIDGVEVAVTEMLHQGGAVNDETGARFAIGNLDTAAHPKDYPFDGVIQEVRYYDRILTSTEIGYLANYVQTNAISNGLLFYGPFVRTAELAHFIDLTLTDDDKVLDAVFGAVGSRSYQPIVRALYDPPPVP